MRDALERQIQELRNKVERLERVPGSKIGYTKSAEASGIVSTSSTSYVALSGDPSVQAEIFGGGGVLVVVSAMITPGATNGLMSFAISGLNTRAANDMDAAEVRTGAEGVASRMTFLTGLTPGLSTFAARYRAAAAASVSFEHRRIIVIPI
jgi:hypothetical protein